MIPDTFKLAGFEITVDKVEKTDGNNYGYWNDVHNTIVIAKNISTKNGELTPLSDSATGMCVRPLTKTESSISKTADIRWWSR